MYPHGMLSTVAIHHMVPKCIYKYIKTGHRQHKTFHLEITDGHKNDSQNIQTKSTARKIAITDRQGLKKLFLIVRNYGTIIPVPSLEYQQSSQL